MSIASSNDFTSGTDTQSRQIGNLVLWVWWCTNGLVLSLGLQIKSWTKPWGSAFLVVKQNRVGYAHVKVSLSKYRGSNFSRVLLLLLFLYTGIFILALTNFWANEVTTVQFHSVFIYNYEADFCWVGNAYKLQTVQECEHLVCIL